MFMPSISAFFRIIKVQIGFDSKGPFFRPQFYICGTWNMIH